MERQQTFGSVVNPEFINKEYETNIERIEELIDYAKKTFELQNVYFDNLHSIEDEYKQLIFEEIKQLLNSPRNLKIKKTFNYRAFCVINDEKTLLYSGLRERLKKVLWINTEENPMKRNKTEIIKRSTPAFYNPKSKSSERVCSTYGATHGIKVHQQLQQFTNCFYETNGMDKIYEEILDPDMCTINIVSAIYKENWIPIASEFMIWQEDWRVATAVDMIVLDTKTSELIVLEFKTGYESEEYEVHPNDEFLPEPFDNLVNCPLIRHMFQLIGMICILNKKYGTNINRGYIVRSKPKAKTVELIGLCDWCKDLDFIRNLEITMESTK
jgi:hypothetical protein